MEEENKAQGFVALFRSLLDWEWYQDANTMRVFIHCLLRANHQPKKWRGIVVDTGTFISSRSVLASELGLSEKEVRTALKHLAETGEVASKSTNKFTLYKVNNWEKYQQKGRQEGTQRAGKGPAKGQQRATNNNDNNENKVTNTTTSYGDAGSDYGESDEMHDRQGMQEEPKGSVIDQVFPEYPYGIRSKLNELYIRLRHKPTAAEFEEWRKALAACHSDEDRIRMIRYSLGDNQKGRTYKNLYPERGKKTKPDALPIWYDELPDQQPSRKEDVAKARRLREEILGGK